MHNWKRIAAAFLVVVQLFLLCGCTALDEMRQNHAFVQDKDIVWNGATYRLLPACDTLCPDADYETSIYATAPDVPVLLSFFYADNVLSPSQDGRFLISFFEDMIYCREDQYEQIKQRIRDGFETALVCYTYDIFDPEGEYILTDEQVAVLELITSTVEPKTMGEGWTLEYDWSVMLEACSEDKLFRRYDLDIARVGKSYYLLLYTDTGTLVFTVPDGCNAQLDEITKAYVTAWESYYEPDTEDWI